MIIVLGSLNRDLVMEVPRFPIAGETIAGSGLRTCSGGKGANQAVAAARMGLRTIMLGAVGDDPFGDQIVTDLQDAGVDVARLKRCVGVASGCAMILVNPAGENEIVVSAGANAALTRKDVEAEAHLIHASNAVIAQLETPLEATAAAFELARASGVLTVLNPAPARTLDDATLRLCDWLVPNDHEAAWLAGMETITLSTAAEAARRLRERSPATNFAITLGADGVWIDACGTRHHQPGFRVPAVDTVAAGDTFVGVFVSCLAESIPLAEAARFACAAAALAVTRRGALGSIPTRPEIEQFLRANG